MVLILFALFLIWGFALPPLLHRHYVIEDIQNYVIDGIGSYKNHKVFILDLKTADDSGFRFTLSIDDEHMGFCKSYKQSLFYAYRIIEDM